MSDNETFDPAVGDNVTFPFSDFIRSDNDDAMTMAPNGLSKRVGKSPIRDGFDYMSDTMQYASQLPSTIHPAALHRINSVVGPTEGEGLRRLNVGTQSMSNNLHATQPQPAGELRPVSPNRC